MAADDKTATATLVRGFNKRVGRTKEIVLQSMGKVDRTEDGTFDYYVANFTKQQANSTKLQKYMGNYIGAVRAVVHASIAFQDALKEVYEDEWAGKFELINDLDLIKQCSHEYLRELDKSSTALYSYQAQFPDMRAKIEKRNRKLVDYDATRHTIETLKTSKKRDDNKLRKKTNPTKKPNLKAEEKNADAKRLYEHLNTELHDLLPALFDSRIVSYGAMLQSLFTAESSFHGEISKQNANLSEVIDKLVEERGRGTYSSRREGSVVAAASNGAAAPLFNGVDASVDASPSATPLLALALDRTASMEAAPAAAAETTATVEPVSAPTETPVEAAPVINEPTAPEPVKEEAAAAAPVAAAAAAAAAAPEVDVSSGSSDAATAGATAAASAAAATDDKDIYTVPTNNKAAPLPAGVLKRVLATHPYAAEDEDELTFGPNDVFCVLPYEDPEEADDGWYYGYVEGKPDRKGVFPANFTRPLE